ncbi:MAG: hypothetical protein WBH13_09350 [Parasynechococcus sp.]|nr:hypothetical protein [Synechococcus sp. BS307-5m-G36]MBL6880038.1 hypothetical protein [Synechococcus sp. BS30m-G31]
MPAYVSNVFRLSIVGGSCRVFVQCLRPLEVLRLRRGCAEAGNGSS